MRPRDGGETSLGPACSLQVSDGSMAPETTKTSRFTVLPFDRHHNFFVTLPAGALGDLGVARHDLDLIGKSSGRERERMAESILRLRQVFRNEPGRRVTVIANGD